MIKQAKTWPVMVPFAGIAEWTEYDEALVNFAYAWMNRNHPADNNRVWRLIAATLIMTLRRLTNRPRKSQKNRGVNFGFPEVDGGQR